MLYPLQDNPPVEIVSLSVSVKFNLTIFSEPVAWFVFVLNVCVEFTVGAKFLVTSIDIASEPLFPYWSSQVIVVAIILPFVLPLPLIALPTDNLPAESISILASDDAKFFATGEPYDGE